jgi:hypothetical protein
MSSAVEWQRLKTISDKLEQSAVHWSQALRIAYQNVTKESEQKIAFPNPPISLLGPTKASCMTEQGGAGANQTLLPPIPQSAFPDLTQDTSFTR